MRMGKLMAIGAMVNPAMIPTSNGMSMAISHLGIPEDDKVAETAEIA